MRGQYLYLSDAPDDGDGALETPLQQLGTEGLLLGPDQSEDIRDQSESDHQSYDISDQSEAYLTWTLGVGGRSWSRESLGSSDLRSGLGTDIVLLHRI